ncbi:NAD(P)/FAD-dependent oxidoreductase [Ohtaekwangia koreensis]|uniref:NADH:ubiquinone reductase (non-electrogenic) n=1 Tax=Ohtaekwangia koreensis TaxID=688867 RepID=A0A1T5J9E0_9BACT|nr:NAD(P)/FAD-dependent oxidoreductase [Ohtaekwangia koreensis]SKC47954.1 NADH dehydrogenase [Ohtaekwangia koreensis]
MSNAPKKIVVVGGGFAGLNFIKRLANDMRFQITLVDNNNYHFFPPLLYQVGMAFIEPSNISYPFRRMFQQKKNLRFHLGCLVRINTAENTIETERDILPYDYLVLALGTETNYFGMENVKKNSWTLKTINDATNLRNHLLLNMEKAVKTVDLAERKKLLNVVIAGGGPTGVEVAGMLAEMAHKIGPKEYPEITGGSFPIYLIEAGKVLLGPMSIKAQEEATAVLKKLGIIVKLNTAVKDYVDGKVMLSNGEVLETNALIWTSGVIGREVRGLPAEIFGRGRRIMVDEYCKVKGTQNIFAVGDIALHTLDKKFPAGHPQLAQVAIQQGKLLAENFVRLYENNSPKAFLYKDRGSMAIISKYKAVADLPNAFVKGFFAWVVWLFIHLIPIAGFRNKVKLAFSWTWSFITDDPTLRLIIRPRPEEFTDRENKKDKNIYQENLVER